MVRYNPSQLVQGPIRMAEVLAALSLATDLGAGRSMGHAMRVCTLSMQMAGELHLSTAEKADMTPPDFLMFGRCHVYFKNGLFYR